MEVTLSARSPFLLPTVIRSHGWIRLAPFQEDEDEQGFTYLAHLSAGRVVELRVRVAEQGATLQVDEALTEAEQREIVDKAHWMLGLDQDFSDFYGLARAEPKLAHVVEKAQGRLLRSSTLFEDVVKTIMTTNTAWSGTIRMAETAASQYGSPLLGDPTRRAFPTPAQLARLDEATLRRDAGLGYRAPHVLELAQRVDAGELDLEGLKGTDLSTPELRKALLSIKGVGGYAAATLLMLLGRYDALPIDSQAFKMVSHEWHNGESIGPKEVEAAFTDWGEWKGLAYWFWDWAYDHEG